MNNKPLDKNFLKNRKKSLESLDELDKQVFDRFKYIMKRIGVACKTKISDRKLMKYVKDYLEEVGDDFIADYLQLQTEYLFYASDVLTDVSPPADFMIPTKWFYGEFESDLAKLVKEDYDRLHDATIESIKSKLTKKELEILGLDRSKTHESRRTKLSKSAL